MKKSKMKPSMSGMGLEDEKLKPGKTKIIKAQIGKYLEQDRLRKTYQDYKERLDQQREDKMRQDQEDSYRRRVQEYQTEREMYRMPRQLPSEGYISDYEREQVEGMMPKPQMKKGGMIVAKGSKLVKVKPTKLY